MIYNRVLTLMISCPRTPPTIAHTGLSSAKQKLSKQNKNQHPLLSSDNVPVVKIWCIFRTVPGQPWLCHLVALSVDLTGVLIWLPCLGSYLTGGLARLPCLGSYLVTLPRDLLGDLTLDFNWRPNLGLGNLTFLGDLTLGLIW